MGELTKRAGMALQKFLVVVFSYVLCTYRKFNILSPFLWLGR